MHKKLLIFVVIVTVLLGSALLLRFLPGVSDVLWRLSDGGKWLLPLLVVSAIVDSVNPCAFSILLLTIAFLFSVGTTRSNIVKIGSVYILGIFLVYIFIGLGILQALHIFNMPHFMAKVGATLMIAFGLIGLINQFFPSFPIKLKIPTVSHRWIGLLMEKASLPAIFGLGVLVGLCEFPCTGGPYLMVLGLLHDQATYWSGAGYLLLYNVIFVLPLVVILAIASNETLFTKAQQWKQQENHAMRLWGSVIMIILGVAVFFL